MSRQVVHADFIAFQPHAAADARKRLLAEAAALRSIDGVLQVAAIEAEPGCDFDLALLFLLRDFPALEPFGTHPAYARFLQGGVAPLLRAFAGTDVELEDEARPLLSQAACLAVAAPRETYDWEVRELLQDWGRQALGQLDGASLLGLAVGERQRYRGIVVVSSSERIPALPPVPERFSASTVRGAATALA